jgi:hypothetical protein
MGSGKIPGPSASRLGLSDVRRFCGQISSSVLRSGAVSASYLNAARVLRLQHGGDDRGIDGNPLAPARQTTTRPDEHAVHRGEATVTTSSTPTAIQEAAYKGFLQREPTFTVTDNGNIH